MNRVDTLMKFGLVLWCGLSGGAALAHSPDDHTYKVNVFSSFGTQFEDCFAFDRKSGTLTITGYGKDIYRHDQLNTQPEAWQATSSKGNLFILSFHGAVGGSGGQTIIADGLNEFGDTFILQGIIQQPCASPAAKQSSASPWRR
jgi:hypothetical protein